MNDINTKKTSWGNVFFVFIFMKGRKYENLRGYFIHASLLSLLADYSIQKDSILNMA